MLLLRLALQSLLRSKLTLALLVAAVTAGVAFQIPNAANLEGYTRELMRQGMARASGDLLIAPPRAGAIEEVSALLGALRRHPAVKAVAPRLVHGGVISRAGEHQPVRLVGLVPEVEEQATLFCHRLAQGRCPAPGKGSERSVLLGSALAERLAIRTGERLKLIVPYEELGEVRYSSAWYTVAGVLEGGGGFSADSDCFLRLEVLQRLVGADDRASAVSVQLADGRDVAASAAALRPLVGALRVSPWWEVSAFVADAISGNRAIGAVSTAMVIAAVMIPVSALLYILVLHERRSIAVLGALGFTRRALFAIYLLKAALVGLAGAVLGNGFGFLLCRYFQARPIFSHGGFVVRPELPLSVAAVPTLVLFAVTVLSGILPALVAARCNVASELREA